MDSRANLCGGSKTDSENHYLTVDAVRRAVRYLKVMNAPKINGYYAGIIHPDCSYDLMSDPKWVNVKTYSDPDGIYEGEIGRIEGVRFVETSEAKVFTHAGKDYETGTTASGTVTPKASARDVYSTLILGADAYGVTEITGGGLQHIVKQLGSAGTADPWTSAPPQAGKPPRWPSAWWRRTWSVSRPAPPSTANHRGRLLYGGRPHILTNRRYLHYGCQERSCCQ